jgi:hypothetical protein
MRVMREFPLSFWDGKAACGRGEERHTAPSRAQWCEDHSKLLTEAELATNSAFLKAFGKRAALCITCLLRTFSDISVDIFINIVQPMLEDRVGVDVFLVTSVDTGPPAELAALVSRTRSDWCQRTGEKEITIRTINFQKTYEKEGDVFSGTDYPPDVHQFYNWQICQDIVKRL